MEAVHDTLLLICADADGDPVWRKAVTNNCDTIVIAVPKGAQFNPLDTPSALERQVYQAKMEANVQLVLYRDTPRVLVDVEHAPRVDVTRAGFEGGLDHPYAP